MGTLLPRAVEQLGVEFTFLTRAPEHYARQQPPGVIHPLLAGRAVVTADTNDPADGLRAAREIDADLRIDGVLTACDYYLPLAAHISSALGLVGPSPDSIADACDKTRTRVALDHAGLVGPHHQTVCLDDEALLRAAADEIGYPLVVKPTDLCAGMFVRRADSWPDVVSAVAQLRSFDVNARGQKREPVVLLEQFLDGPEFSVESWVHRGRVHSLGVTDKSLGGDSGFVETGHMYPAHLGAEDRSALIATAEQAIAAVGLDDVVVHTELRLTRDGPRIIEINPRPAGNQITELIRYIDGIDLPSVAVELALGRDPSSTGGSVCSAHRSSSRSAAVSMLVPHRAGTLTSLHGTDAITDHPAVVSATFKEPGHLTASGANNNSYLGNIIALSDEPGAARRVADDLLAGLEVTISDTRS